MSQTPPSVEPRSFVAGSTVSWKKSLVDYPASDGWTLKYFLRGPGEALDITCTVAGATHVATISATNSKREPGDYWMQGRVENAGGEKYVVFEDRVVVEPALDAANTFDGRSENELMLANVRLALGKAVSKNAAEYQIANRMKREHSIPDLIAWESRLLQLVNQERQAAALKKGAPFFANVHTRFIR